MPIYAPTLPPRPDLKQGLPPALVILRFDLRRALRQKLGKFFGFALTGVLLILLAVLYFKYLVETSEGLSSLKVLSDAALSQGPRFQAGLLNDFMLFLLWLQVALVGGGLIARDTLHRVRPLLYAHPVRRFDYLLGKALFAAGLPFAVMLVYILLPWGLSLAVAGARGPVWPSAPLLLVPAAAMIALLMGSVALGASSMAGTPRAGFGWALGIMFGSGALSGVAVVALHDLRWSAVNLGTLCAAWPRLLVGADSPVGWGPVLAGTLLHLALWSWVAVRRTRPDEAVL